MTVWTPGQPVQMETERFTLRSLTQDDATDTYISWWNDADVQEGLGAKPRGWGVQQARRHISRFSNARSFHLGIFCRDDQLLIGFIAVFVELPGVVKTNTVIGNKDFWGQRVVLEVRDRVIQFAFDQLGASKVVGQVDGRNFSSIYNYKAQGFKTEGVLRQQLPNPDGTRHDQVLFGLLKSEWQPDE